MRRRPGTWFAAITLLLGLVGGVALWEHRAARSAATLLAEARDKCALLKQRDLRFERGLLDLSRQQRTAEASLKRFHSQSVGPKRPSRQKLQARTLLDHPDLFALYLRSYQASSALRFRPLFGALHLSPTQIQQFQELTAENKRLQIAAQAETGLGTASSGAFTAATTSPDQAGLQAAMNNLLGPEGYDRLQNYERTLPARDAINQIVLFAAESAPITNQQADVLTQLVADADPAYRQGGQVGDVSDLDWAAIVDRSQTILSAPQVNILKTLGADARLAATYAQVFYQQEAEDAGAK